MKRFAGLLLLVLLTCISGCQSAPGAATRDAATGWLGWRGPNQNGAADLTGLPVPPSSEDPADVRPRWSIDLAGRGTPVIARYRDGDRLYAWGYRGEGADLVEVLACIDPDTGEVLWERRFSDFLSDIIYSRYAIGSPAVDPETGHVYLMTSPGLLMGFDRRGNLLWEVSMMEQFGRLTFPNGRTGAPVIEGDLVIVNAISTNWGREGPARNRFYAFDKRSGDLVWSSTPGVGPPFLKDSSFSTPVFEWRDGRRVFYAGIGCGNIVCVNARTGEPLWRYQFARGGVNASVVLRGDTLFAVHGKENTDNALRGRMVAIELGHVPEPGAKGPVVLDRTNERWRNDEISMFTSSPVIVDDRLFQVTIKGDLVCLDTKTGHEVWSKKLGADQLHASPIHADGRLYVPMWHDGLYVIEPGEDDATILSRVRLEGGCIGSPAAWDGKLYVHTTKKLYCFAGPRGVSGAAPSRHDDPSGPTTTGDAARLQVLPAEVLLRPRTRKAFRIRTIDALGHRVSDDAPQDVSWSKWVPPTAKVKARLDADFEQGALVAGQDATISAGAFKAQSGDLSGTIRGRLLPSPPYRENFDAFTLGKQRKDGTPFAYPPLPWIGARLKWEIREVNGRQALTKTLDRWLFQRSTVFIGHPDESNYTVRASVMSDGNRRMMSDVGVINQRYVIVLRGNSQQIEVNSNIERLAVKAPFAWKPKRWCRLETRVDVNPDGSGVVRARAWPEDEARPREWSIEVPVRRAHRRGSPGLYGFSPNIRHAVYIDDIEVMNNE